MGGCDSLIQPGGKLSLAEELQADHLARAERAHPLMEKTFSSRMRKQRKRNNNKFDVLT